MLYVTPKYIYTEYMSVPYGGRCVVVYDGSTYVVSWMTNAHRLLQRTFMSLKSVKRFIRMRKMVTVRMTFDKVLVRHENITVFLITILHDDEPQLWVVQNTAPDGRTGIIDTERGYYDEEEAVSDVIRELTTQSMMC